MRATRLLPLLLPALLLAAPGAAQQHPHGAGHARPDSARHGEHAGMRHEGTPTDSAAHARMHAEMMDEDAVRAAVRAFHDALAAGDTAAVVALLHPDVTIYEGGHAEDLAEYRAHHLAADVEFLRGVRQTVTDESLEMAHHGAMATYMAETRARGTFRDREIDSHGAETLVLVHTHDGWKVRHVHWSSR